MAGSYTGVMQRVLISVGAGIAGVIALWVGTLLWLNATVYAPESLVSDYLDALTSGDVATASAVGGLGESPRVAPGPDALPANHEITGIQPTDDNRVLVRATYTLDGARENSVFTLEPRERLWGLFDQWAFSTPPTATIEAAVSGLDTVRVSGVDVGRTDAASLPVLVPARYSLSARSQWLTSADYSTTIREPGSVWSVDMDLRPTSALVDEVNSAVDEYLSECALRQVLQPSSCPFGVRVTDRLATLPTWAISKSPALALEPTTDPDTWQMVALGGEATISTTLQSLFDGSLRDYSEVVSFALTGVVTGLDGESPALRID